MSNATNPTLEIQKHRLALCQVRLMIDDATSESTLSQALRGVIPLAPDIERKIAVGLGQLEGEVG
jgi:hypothetical protein